MLMRTEMRKAFACSGYNRLNCITLRQHSTYRKQCTDLQIQHIYLSENDRTQGNSERIYVNCL